MMKFNFDYFKTFSGIFKVVEWVESLHMYNYRRNCQINVAGAAHHFDLSNKIRSCDIQFGKYRCQPPDDWNLCGLQHHCLRHHSHSHSWRKYQHSRGKPKYDISSVVNLNF